MADVNPILELAEWHEWKDKEEASNANDLGPCDGNKTVDRLRRKLKEMHITDAARHRATAAALRALDEYRATDPLSSNTQAMCDNMLKEIKP